MKKLQLEDRVRAYGFGVLAVENGRNQIARDTSGKPFTGQVVAISGELVRVLGQFASGEKVRLTFHMSQCKKLKKRAAVSPVMEGRWVKVLSHSPRGTVESVMFQPKGRFADFEPLIGRDTTVELK